MGSDTTIRRVHGGTKAAVAFFLVEHRGVLSIVDTGIERAGDRAMKALRAMGRRPEDVRQIVLTHGHGDHAGSARRLRDVTGAPVVAHAADAPFIAGKVEYPGPVDRIMATLFADLERFPRFEVDRTVEGREELEGGLVAIPAPGHTDGHMVVAIPAESIVFAGDLVFHVGPLRPSLRRLTQDPRRNAESIREVAGERFARVIPGHGSSLRGEQLTKLARRLKP